MSEFTIRYSIRIKYLVFDLTENVIRKFENKSSAFFCIKNFQKVFLEKFLTSVEKVDVDGEFVTFCLFFIHNFWEHACVVFVSGRRNKQLNGTSLKNGPFPASSFFIFVFSINICNG